MTVRENPRISVSKIVEYLEAGAGRRRSILIDQKFPQDSIISYYRDTFEGIEKFMTSGFDESTIESCIQKLHNAEFTSPQQATRISSCIAGLQAMLRLSDRLKSLLDGLIIEPASRFQLPSLQINNVMISVRPEFYVRAKNLDGSESLGLVKFYIGKQRGLSVYGGECAALIAEQHLSNMRQPYCTPDRNLVIMVDLFGGNIFKTPRSYRKKLTDIEACCAEINQVWGGLERRTSVKGNLY